MVLHLHSKAADDLRFIRQAMERAEGVSSVSGLGGIWMGAIALGAAALAAQHAELTRQLTVWIYAAPAAAAVGAVACWRKGSRKDALVHWDPVRRFLLCLVPPVGVGVVLTWRLWDVAGMQALPAIWLMLYGSGVIAAGTYAVPAVLYLGASFLATGIVAMALPGAWANGLLAFGFGGLHIVFGWWIYKRHGG